MIRKFLILAFLCSSALLFPAYLKRWTRSFHLQRCQIDFPFDPNWEADTSIPLDQIFSQPFHFLNRGSQAFVFQSADRRYVLKIFFFDSLQAPLWKKLFDSAWRKPAEQIHQKSRRTLNSCKAAFERAADETGLIYIHLNPKEKEQPTLAKLCGPAWHRTTVNLDQFRFAIQRTACTLEQTLLQDYASNDPTAYRLHLDQWIELVKRRAQLGMRNSDPKLMGNFGFEGDKAVEIDVGNYELAMNHDVTVEIQEYLTELSRFAERSTPEWKDIVLEKRADAQ